jgi:hypothetical protein
VDAFGIPFVGFPVERRKRPKTGDGSQKRFWIEPDPKKQKFRVRIPNVRSWAVGVTEPLADLIRKQRKGQRRGKKKNAAANVVVPVAQLLKAALDAELARRRAAEVSPLVMTEETICLTSEGEPWKEGRDGYNGFISSFRKAKEEAGIAGVNFSDLRGTAAVTRLALAGCTVPEICAITGHSHDEANAILQAHYLHRDPQLAWNAIRKLELWAPRQDGASEGVASGAGPPPETGELQTAVPVLQRRTKKTT